MFIYNNPFFSHVCGFMTVACMFLYGLMHMSVLIVYFGVWSLQGFVFLYSWLLHENIHIYQAEGFNLGERLDEKWNQIYMKICKISCIFLISMVEDLKSHCQNEPCQQVADMCILIKKLKETMYKGSNRDVVTWLWTNRNHVIYCKGRKYSFVFIFVGRRDH